MNKKILSIVLTICMVLGFIYISPVPVEASKDVGWQEAYVEVFNNPDVFLNLVGAMICPSLTE